MFMFYFSHSGSKKIFDLDDDDSFKSPYEAIVKKPSVKKAGKVSDENERFSRLTALSQGNLLTANIFESVPMQTP